MRTHRRSTVGGIKTHESVSGSAVNITGRTEVGHASGVWKPGAGNGLP